MEPRRSPTLETRCLNRNRSNLLNADSVAKPKAMLPASIARLATVSLRS